MRTLTHELLSFSRRLGLLWLIAFVALSAYWSVSESVEPGQQYADPFLPCAYVALLLSLPIAAVSGLVQALRDYRKMRRAAR